tara:strand:- start:76 stop:273 length:198 start_codon:yes stop_codon:yes gene_type:complete
MGVTNDLKAFANEHPVVAIVAGGAFTFYALGLFGYGFVGGKIFKNSLGQTGVADSVTGINGYHTW